MSDTRSQALIQFESDTASEIQRFISPDGRVTLLKSYYVTNNGTGEGTYDLLVVRNGMNYGIVIALGQLAPGASAFWQGWVALNPSDVILLLVGGIAMNSWVSGAVLSGANQFPPGGPADLETLPAGLVRQLGLS